MDRQVYMMNTMIWTKQPSVVCGPNDHKLQDLFQTQRVHCNLLQADQTFDAPDACMYISVLGQCKDIYICCSNASLLLYICVRVEQQFSRQATRQHMLNAVSSLGCDAG
jgi:hypothetical protein